MGKPPILTKYSGIITRNTPYKEGSNIVNLLTKEGSITFKISGLKKNPLYLSYVNPLTKGTYFLKGDKALSFKEACDIEPFDFFNDWNKTLFGQSVTELSQKFFAPNNDYGYDLLDLFLTKVKENKDIASLFLDFLSYVIKKEGYGLNVESCQTCGTKENITAMSFKKGGFLCKAHDDHLGERFNLNELKIFRHLFSYPLNDFGNHAYPEEECFHLIKCLSKYLSEISQTHLAYLSFLK